MLPVEIKSSERQVPQGNNNLEEIIVPKYLEGVVPPIFNKNKDKIRSVDAKSKTNTKVWKHSLDLSGFKPEEIQVNCSDSNTVSVTAEKAKSNDHKGFQLRRTVFVPGGVDMCNISSFVSDDGKLVIQAPYQCTPSRESCQKCSLKRKLNEAPEKSQGYINAKKLRTELIDTSNGTENQCDSEPVNADADRRHQRGALSCPPSGNTRSYGTGNRDAEEETVDIDLTKPDPSPKSNMSNCKTLNSHKDKSPSLPESNSVKAHSCTPSPKTQVNSDSIPTKPSPVTYSNTVKSVSPPPKVVGISEGFDVSYKDIGRLPSVRRQSVVLSVPIENFFPDRDDIVISLQGNTLKIKATRVQQVKHAKLSELFVKELVFPPHFDCRSIQLARDPQGSLIVTVDKSL
ncbi:uncharacterized protein LOC133174364 [Saccostrea echinata]|uniref:uncharacterized protein LOC133174364 n=1 Tax=Saccostrea echinata TaxID=191078 RepID=UPI002A83D530|nr:uncharacterized protein LOC133174364 [Saccostrea echinata]